MQPHLTDQPHAPCYTLASNLPGCVRTQPLAAIARSVARLYCAMNWSDVP